MIFVSIIVDQFQHHSKEKGTAMHYLAQLVVGCSLECLRGSEFCTFRCKLRLCELAVEVRRLCNGAARCKSLLLLSAVRALDLDLAAGLRYGAPPTTNNTIKTPPVRLSRISAPFFAVWCDSHNMG